MKLLTRKSLLQAQILHSIALSITIGAWFLPPCNAERISSKPTPAELDESAPPPSDMPSESADSSPGPIHSSLPPPAASSTRTAKPSDISSAPAEVKFKEPISTTPTVTYGPPPWGPKRVASSVPGLPARTPTPGAIPPAANALPVAGNSEIELEKRLADPRATLNIHIVKHYHLPPTDTVMAYPWPVRPPKEAPASRLQEKPEELKHMILATGYSNRIDFRRPHPLYGWRWIHAFTAAHAKSGLGYPHTILTMYHWVDQMSPYVVREVKRVNAIEAARGLAWKKVNDEYERTHLEIETDAAAKGLFPVEIKVTAHGMGQTQLPPGNWWISATRKLPDLKFYWQVPVTVSAGQSVNVELNNVNAIVVQGGW